MSAIDGTRWMIVRDPLTSRAKPAFDPATAIRGLLRRMTFRRTTLGVGLFAIALVPVGPWARFEDRCVRRTDPAECLGASAP